MRELFIALVLLVSAAVEVLGAPGATECTPERFHFGGRQSYTRQEVIDAGRLASLKAVASDAPLSVTGGNAGGYRITVCKAAAEESDLAAIRIVMQNGELRAEGPDRDRWTVSFHIEAPDGANLALETENGPVSVADFDGTLLARTKNGPVTLRDVDGEIDAAATNGPVSITGGSGEFKVNASNGPVTVRLKGAAWSGSLDAVASNGPLTVAIPRSYGSGVVVETRGGPFLCSAALCDSADLGLEDWARPRRIELGNGPVAVRISASNGPVTIRESD